MSYWTSKALVTGGAGFIGSHVVEALQKAGVQVLVVDNFRTGRSAVLEEIGSPDFREVDICSEEMSDLVASFQPDTIFHLAAQINVRKSVDEPVFDAQENVLGTTRLLEAAKNNGVSRFIFSSTGGAIYGEQDYFPADEAHPIRPKCPYGVSKRGSELYLEYYGNHFDMQTTSMRFSNVYGPRQNPKGEAGVVAIFTDRLLNGEALRVNGDGEQTRDFVYVGDVVAAMLTAGGLERSAGYEVFNVGRGVETSVNEVVSVLRDVWEALGQDGLTFVVDNGPALAGEQLRSVISPKKLESVSSWSAGVDLRAGLLKTVKHFLQSQAESQ